MLENILSWLETSARYGLTDLVLAAGIFGGVRKLVRSKPVKHIEGLEVLTGFIGQKILDIELRNHTKETMYIPRAYLRVGYYVTDYKKSLFFRTWIRTDSVRISREEPINNNGLHLLMPVDGN